MQEDKFIMFGNRLSKMYRHLGKQAKRMGVTCYRVYDHDLPEFPFCIEFFGEKLYMAEYIRRHGMTGDEHEAWLQKSRETAAGILGVSQENIFLKTRKRKTGRQGQYQKLDTTQHEWVVEENGLKFIVNLSDYLDTGLFLDHRITREMVKKEAAGKKVLNLFAYTGSFSVYAAAGGATHVVTVDLSNTYLEWAERNMKLNGFMDAEKYTCQRADVKAWLGDLKTNSFDRIIMDPPTFSNSKKMDGFLDIQKDHVILINECLRVLQPGGVLYFSTNYRKFRLEKERIDAAVIKDITRQTTPFDFEGRLFRYCFRVEK